METIKCSDRREYLTALDLSSDAGLLPRLLVALALTVYAGARVLIHGQPSARKTWLILVLAVRAVIGGERVLLLLGEGGRTTIKRRLELICAGLGVRLEDLGDRLVVRLGGIDLINGSDSVVHLGAEIERLNLSIVFVDPLAAFFAGEENSARDVGTLLRLLDEVATAGIAVVVVHHDRKLYAGGTADPRGSSALRAWADDVYSLSIRADMPSATIVTHTKSRDHDLATPQRVVFAFDTSSLRTTVSCSTSRTQDALEALVLRIVAKAPDGIGLSALRTGAKRSSGHVRRALDSLIAAGRVTTTGTGNRTRYFASGPLDTACVPVVRGIARDANTPEKQADSIEGSGLASSPVSNGTDGTRA